MNIWTIFLSHTRVRLRLLSLFVEPQASAALLLPVSASMLDGGSALGHSLPPPRSRDPGCVIADTGRRWRCRTAREGQEEAASRGDVTSRPPSLRTPAGETCHEDSAASTCGASTASVHGYDRRRAGQSGLCTRDCSVEHGPLPRHTHAPHRPLY